MTAPASMPEPLEVPRDAEDLYNSLRPQGPREAVLAREAAWAAAHLLNLMGDAPAEPDPRWLRLFTLADRILHRNLRILDRRPAHQADPSIPVPAPTTTPAPAPASQPPTASRPPQPVASRPRLMPRPTPTAPARRPDPSHRPRPNLDLSSATAPLPIRAASHTPSG